MLWSHLVPEGWITNHAIILDLEGPHFIFCVVLSIGSEEGSCQFLLGQELRRLGQHFFSPPNHAHPHSRTAIRRPFPRPRCLQYWRIICPAEFSCYPNVCGEDAQVNPGVGTRNSWARMGGGLGVVNELGRAMSTS